MEQAFEWVSWIWDLKTLMNWDQTGVVSWLVQSGVAGLSWIATSLVLFMRMRSYKHDLNDAEESTKIWKKLYEDKQIEAGKLLVENSSLDKDCTSESNRASKLEAERDTLNKLLAEHKTSQTAHEERIGELEDQVCDLTTQLENRDEEQDETDKRISELEKDLQYVQHDLDNANDEFGHLQKRYTLLQLSYELRDLDKLIGTAQQPLSTTLSLLEKRLEWKKLYKEVYPDNDLYVDFSKQLNEFLDTGC